jgi:threonine dehydrogenase-like Zn-dependent dehydrogenase
MITVLLDGDGGVSFADKADPVPAAGEALVRVLKAGICSTDLELKRGYMQFRGIPGHEFVGVVESCDSRPDLVGRRVVSEINVACRECDLCRRELERHCRNRSVLGILGRPGAFAELLSMPVRNLHAVPDAISDDRALFVEPVAAAFEILEQVEVLLGDSILVIGDGRLGSLCARVLHRTGARVSVLGKHERKQEPLRKDGISTLDPKGQPEKSFDIVVEASGSPGGLEGALWWVRPRGTVVLKTTCAGKHDVSLAPVVIDEITLVGSRCGPFKPALLALERGDLRPEETIDARYPLVNVEKAFAKAGEPGVRKVILEITD